MNIIKIKIYYYIFFKKLLKKFFLVSRIERVRYLNLGYKKKDLSFEDEKLKDKR